MTSNSISLMTNSTGRHFSQVSEKKILSPLFRREALRLALFADPSGDVTSPCFAVEYQDAILFSLRAMT